MRFKRSVLIVVIVALFVISLGFVFAAHNVTFSGGSSEVYLDEDVSYFYNVSVENTDGDQVANVTEVNITLPNNFVSSPSTNGTDTSSIFSVSGQVLSWSNITEFVVNGSDTNHFWFNATVTWPGSYNITVATTNGTFTSRSNLSVFVNDTSGPTVNLSSPPNSSSSTATSYNFTFNVTDYRNISLCYLVVDDSVYQNSSDISRGVNGFYNGTFAAGVHNWSVHCEDVGGFLGNSPVWIFTVTQQVTTEEEETTTSGAGGGGYPTLNANEKEMKGDGYKARLQRNWKVMFTAEDGRSHKLTAFDFVEGKSAKVKVESNPIEATINVGGDGEKFDLDGNGRYDLRVVVEDVTSSIVEILMYLIDEPIPSSHQEAPAVSRESPAEEAPTDNVQQSPASSPREDSSLGVTEVVVTVILVIVAVAIGLYLQFYKGRKLKKAKK